MPQIQLDIEAAVPLLRALANPSRLRIALQVAQGESAVADLERVLGIRQPALSQHLAVLRDAGLLTTRRESRTIYYKLAEDHQVDLLKTLLQHLMPASGLNGAVIKPSGPRPQRDSYAAKFATVMPADVKKSPADR